MVWGIIGAMEKEVALIKEYMQITETRKVCGLDYYVGTMFGKNAVLVQCSVGTINAASCAGIIIREFGANAVINVGIAGAAGNGLGVMDVVISKDVVFHDADAVITKFYPFANRFAADKRLIDLALKSCLLMDAHKFKYRIGTVATGDIFVNDKEVKDDIIRRVAPDCIEMEGAAIGQIAYMNDNTPFIVIRTMSDNADDEADEVYDNFLETAANNSAHIVLNMIKDADDF